MNILITGASGQLGTELSKYLDEKGLHYWATDSHELDITKKEQVDNFFKKNQPNVVFHCAAYTAVDAAEEEGKEKDELINVEGTRNIALAAKQVNAVLVYISTDYVFDGIKKEGQYEVSDQTNPLNEYGRTKLLGEKIVQETLQEYYIIRTSWVFGQFGHNFVFTMQKLAKTHPQLTVVDDQLGRPTWTRTLAEFMLFVIQEKAPYGTYHLSNEGTCSWYEFAKEILKETPVEVLPIPSAQFPQKAKRPQYSVMDLSKAKKLGFDIPTWQQALAMMLAKL